MTKQLGSIPQGRGAGPDLHDPLPVSRLVRLWNTREPWKWRREPELYASLGKQLVEYGNYAWACDVLAEGLAHAPGHVRMRQLHGLALARSGAADRANSILTRLRREGAADEETLGVLARTCKDLALASRSPRIRASLLEKSHRIYSAAYRSTGGYWTGINAATTALLLGRKRSARGIAAGVRMTCLRWLPRIARNADEMYWLLATLGEAELILGRTHEAAAWYARAIGACCSEWGNVSSTRRNARLILHKLRIDPAFLDQCLAMPSVVVFAGHMIDRPYRPTPRFPSQIETLVSRAIARKLDDINAGFGYSSAACGSDILFLEAMKHRNAERYIVLPFDAESFAEESVDIVPGGNWRRRFAAAVTAATEVVQASPQRVAFGSVVYDYANVLQFGLAKIRAAHLDARLVPLAVWDGHKGDGPAGTDTFVRRWTRQGHDVQVVDVAAILRGQPLRLSTAPGLKLRPRPARAQAGVAPPQVKALLFADVDDYSRLGENQIALFTSHFLRMAAAVLSKMRVRPVFSNTWGDSIFIVFDRVREAGEFALALHEVIARAPWARLGLPSDTGVRIGLHSGPVFECADPVSGRTTFTGSHVIRAARIEPVTPPSRIYASRSYAALEQIN